MKKQTITALKVGTAPLVLGLALISAPVFAQEAPAEASVDDQTIVVTGSRIARPDLEAAVPVAVLSAKTIEDSVANNIQDVLADLPSVGQNLSRTSSNFSTTGNGQATVNLRNLGSARTLVLVNGRRFVSGLPGSSVVDLNTIPTDLIKRVDVVTGGASAIYGSEAIAGVVNFVLDDRFEGLRARAQGTISDKGDAGRQYGSITLGKSFGDGRGNIVVYGQYDRDEGLRSRNRSFSERDIPNRSSFAAQGLFGVDGSFAAGDTTFTFDGNNALKQYEGANTDGYNRNSDRYLSVPVERYLATFLGRYEVSDNVEVYVEGEYAKTKSRSRLEPQAVANTDLTNADGSGYEGIPITNPFIPTAIRNAMIDEGVTALPFRRRSNDIFDRSNVNDRETWRVVGGLRGDIGKFRYDLYYTHGETRDTTSSGTILGPEYRNALNAELSGGVPVCSINVDADPTNNDPNCVPINIFGYNTVSPAAAAYVTRNGLKSTYDARVKQDVVSASLSGELFSLWGGPVAVALGAEYRNEKSVEDFDAATNAGETLGNFLSDTTGEFNVKEAFIEVVAPIVEDRPLIHYFGVEGAFRYADYSTVGGVESWKIGATYAPTRDLRLRAVYAEATRAPNIAELFARQSETFPAVIDPCDQREGEGDSAPITLTNLPAACLAIPAINTAVNAPGGFVYSTAQIQTINGYVGGNQNLNEETAQTLTIGGVFTPSFAPNFSLTVDYYRIKVKDAIGIIGQQTSLDECYTGSGAALFCDNIIRDSAGRVETVNALNLNTGSFLVSGIDVQAQFKTRIAAKADLTIAAFYNHRLKQEQTSFPGGPTQDEIGQLDCYSCGRLGTGFKDKFTTSTTLDFQSFSLNWRMNYLGSVVDTLGEDAIKVGAYWYHDAQLRFKLDEDRKFGFYLGVDNIFDKKPPVFNDTNPVTFPGTQTSANTYDLYGRMLYAGVDFKF